MNPNKILLDDLTNVLYHLRDITEPEINKYLDEAENNKDLDAKKNAWHLIDLINDFHRTIDKI